MDEERNDGEEQVEDTAQQAGGNGSGSAGSWLLRKEILIPLGASAATAAASIASKKLPDLLDRVKEKGSDAGESALSKVAEEGKERAKETLSEASGGGVIGSIASKAMGGGGGGKNKAKTRRLPIQRWTDVAVPVEEAYQAWKRFDEYPKFMHRVVSVEQSDEKKVQWTEKIWFSTRQWEAEIVDDRENDRIAWETKSGTSHSGVVSFHRLSDNLTRVMVTIDFQPSGLLEKMASGLRFAKRAAQADLARFKAYVEFEQSDVEGTPQQQAQAEEGGAEDGGEDGSDQERDEQEEQDEQPKGKGRSQSSSKKSEKSSEDEESDEDREAARKEREQRREQRAKA